MYNKGDLIMNKIKICAKCGSVFGCSDVPAYINEICIDCQSKLLEIDVDVDEWVKILYPKGKSYNYTIDESNQNNKAIWQFNAKIFEKYIEPLGQLDTSLVAYKLNMESYGRPTDDIDEINRQIKEKAIRELHEGRRTRENQNIPKCPTCGSTNIEKISSFDKAAGAVMFGLFSKTARSQFKCKNCGYKW